jgi:diguanylate cyclase (GGDEF)-like protein
MREQELELGIAEVRRRLSNYGLEILQSNRPHPNRNSTYLEIGKPGKETDVVLSDEFVRDLPKTKEYQTALDHYAGAVASRLRCGSPNVFYCLSHVAIRITVNWPIQAAVVENMYSAWLLTYVTDELKGSIAKVSLNLDRQISHSGRTTMDDLRNATNRIRKAIDNGTLTFYEQDSHPDRYQVIKNDSRETNPQRTKSEIEKFLAGKTHMLAFEVPEVPGEVWAVDPWDAEYLGTSKKELSKSAYVLRARDLIVLDSTLNFARPSDKLLTKGWPTAIESMGTASVPQVLTLSRLPKKEELLTELRNSISQSSDIALLIIDLDRFKQVNDTMGHTEGDACLERVIKVIGRSLGRKGTLYRWGGDEFAITLPDFSTEEAAGTAERIRREIEESKPGGEIAVTASVGVCARDGAQNATAETLLDCADKAMYASKSNGKNRVTF